MGTVLLAAGTGSLSGAASLETRLEELAEQNRRLQEQIKGQQQQIEELRGMVGGLNQNGARQERELKELRTQVADDAAPALTTKAKTAARDVRLSGEFGVGFFRSGSGGSLPNSEFRVDDAKVFVEAAVMKDVYLFAGLELVTREASDEFFHVGDLYVDFENVLGDAAKSGLLNLRVGRFAIPFGEEYQRRNMIDNPLVSHSLSDIWGTDEGVEIFGALNRFSYVVAVQNGGHKTLRDYDSDKAMIGRIGWDPLGWLHLSASAMRTGNLTAAGDVFSEVWLGNGFFKALGSPATTTLFSASLAELAGEARWSGGALRALVGRARFDDNDRTADNARRFDFFSIEAEQRLLGKWYGATRLSQIRVPGGYPLVGQGDFGTYVFRSPLTRELRRFSVGLGYRFSPALVWKGEYGFERGHLVTGARRDAEDQLSTEIAMRF